MDNLADTRENYDKGSLDENDISADPIIQFERWYQDAEKAKIKEPNGMTLATSSVNGHPSARIVLLKGFGPKGFAFYSNYDSRKGKELENNPQVAAVFWWKELERQVRIEGTVSKLSRDASISYYHSRPRGSQISAWASPQSEIVSKKELSDKREAVEDKFKDVDPLPLPEFWGGYIIRPTVIEFWQGRENRYHDRLKYHLSDESLWIPKRLAP